jgi:hypothetical protein
MGKSKDKAAAAAVADEAAGEGGADYETKRKFCSVIANPLADEKLSKKVLKLCKRASKRKAIRRGVKEVVKALRKKQKGCVVKACACMVADIVLGGSSARLVVRRLRVVTTRLCEISPQCAHSTPLHSHPL